MIEIKKKYFKLINYNIVIILYQFNEIMIIIIVNFNDIIVFINIYLLKF